MNDMSEKGFLEKILDQLSLKVDKIDFDLKNLSVNLGDKTSTVESGNFTISNIYKGETLITPKINFNIDQLNIPLEDIMPLIEEKLKKK
jgi:hypothetical protein